MKKPIIQFFTEIEALAHSGARFASLVYTAKGTGETARHTVCLGVSVERAYQRDIAILNNEKARLSGVELLACEELLSSLHESLDKGIGNNSNYTNKGVYSHAAGERGIKFHREQGTVYICGFSLNKTVIEPGTYKETKSSAKTLAKKALKEKLKSGRFRMFALSELETVKLNGKTIIFE
jgi:hypothetical protein